MELGNIVTIKGNVIIIRNHKELAPTKNMKLFVDDQLMSGENSNIIFAFTDGSNVNIASNSDVRLKQKSGSKQIIINEGFLHGNISKQAAGKSLIITTANANAIVLGTILEVSNQSSITTLYVIEGKVKLVRRSDGKSIVVTDGYSAAVQEGKPLGLTEFFNNLDPRNNHQNMKD